MFFLPQLSARHLALKVCRIGQLLYLYFKITRSYLHKFYYHIFSHRKCSVTKILKLQKKMLLENITAATLSIQVKTFAFEVTAENSHRHFSLPFGFYCHHLYPSGIQQLADLHPNEDALSHLYVLYTFFLLGNIYCPSSVVLQSPALGNSSCILKWNWSSYQIKTALIYKAFLNCRVLSTPYSQEHPLPFLALV